MEQIQLRARKRENRRGATLVETVILLSAFVMLTLGMLDLGIGVLYYNTLSEAARAGARAAIVHGSLAPSELSAWDDSAAVTAITSRIRPLLQAEGISDSDIAAAVTVSHTDGPDAGSADTGTNDAGDTVTVTVSVPYQPVMGILLGTSTVTLTGKSTMVIAH